MIFVGKTMSTMLLMVIPEVVKKVAGLHRKQRQAKIDILEHN